MTDTEMHILKTASRKSTSGKSTLTYQIGCLPDSTVHIRITNNSGNGFVNTSWYSLDEINKVLAKGSKGGRLTSYILQTVIKGSSNTPAFVMASLSNERILRALKGKSRGYEFLDPEGFNAKMDKLVTSKAKPKRTTTSTRKKAVTKKAPSKKAAIKKRVAARRKTASAH